MGPRGEHDLRQASAKADAAGRWHKGARAQVLLVPGGGGGSPLPTSNIHKLADQHPANSSTSGIINGRRNRRERTVDNFKHFTGSFFQRWYDWEAPIKEVGSGGGGFELRGGHEPDSGLYVLENFCVRPGGGRLAGYRPKLDTYKGGYDNSPKFGLDKVRHSLIDDWFNTVESLEEEPQWYVDRPLAIQQSVALFQMAHSMQRTSANIANIDIVFPRNDTGPGQCTKDWARDDVTTMLLEMRRASHPDLYGQSASWETWDTQLSPWYDYHRFTTLATTTHFHSYMTLEKERAAAWFNSSDKAKRFHGGKGARMEDFEAFLNTPLCFNKALLYQSCYKDDCLRATSKKDSATNRSSWPMFGYRNPLTHAKIVRRFRACALVEGNAQTQRPLNAPNVLMMYRTKTRAMQFQNNLVIEVKHWMKQNLGPTAKLRVRSLRKNTRDSVWELTALYSETDIIFSPYGTECLFSFVMPPGIGSVLIHLTRYSDCMTRLSGLQSGSTTDPYGSTMAAVGGHFMILFLPGFSGHRHRANSVPSELPLRSLNAANCFRQRGTHWRKCLRYETVTPLDADAVKNLVLPDSLDVTGANLRRLVRSMLPDALVPDAPRIVALYNSAPELASRMMNLRTGDPDEERKNVLLIYNTGNWARRTTRGETHDEAQRNVPLFQEVVKKELQVLGAHVTQRVNFYILQVDPDPPGSWVSPLPLIPGVHIVPPEYDESRYGTTVECPTLNIRSILSNATLKNLSRLSPDQLGGCAHESFDLVLADDGVFSGDSSLVAKSYPQLRNWLTIAIRPHGFVMPIRGGDPGASGTVWGDVTPGYTYDSNKENAVVHAGLSKPGETKLYHVTYTAGLPRYPGSTKNGISSRPFGRVSSTTHFKLLTEDEVKSVGAKSLFVLNRENATYELRLGETDWAGEDWRKTLSDKEVNSWIH